MDQALLELLNRRLAHAWLDGPMVALTIVGLAFVPVVAWWPRRGGGRAESNAALLAMLLGVVAAVLVQFVVDRARPADVRLILAQPALFPSYPSGHVASAVAVAVVLLMSAATRRLGVIAALLAALLGLSRVYLGHHFPSDVLGGVLLGSGIGATCFGVFTRRDGVPWRWLLFVHVALMAVVTQLAYLGLVPALPALPMIDKLGHLVLFGVSTLLLDLWFTPERRWIGVPPALLLPASIGFAEELAQLTSPRRSFDLLDLTADLVGMLLFLAIGRALRGPSGGGRQSPEQQPVSNAD